MRHRPHLLVDGPWIGQILSVGPEVDKHLRTVLRFKSGESISYTDGEGTMGIGIWRDGMVERGEEHLGDRPRLLVTLAVASPKSKDRQRFIVEKAQELGVRRLTWIDTEFGQGRVPSGERSAAWARGALEQSRGIWSLEISEERSLDLLPSAVVLDSEAPIGLMDLDRGETVTIAIGPEGGFSERETAIAGTLVSLPTNILRTDTAAIVAAGLLIVGNGS